MNIDEMSGADLDTMVAERVMGWHKVPDDEWEGEMWYDALGGMQFVSYRPSQYLSVAMFAMQKAIEDGCTVILERRQGYYHAGKHFPALYYCRVEKGRDGYVSHATTLPLAMCRVLVEVYTNE